MFVCYGCLKGVRQDTLVFLYYGCPKDVRQETLCLFCLVKTLRRWLHLHIKKKILVCNALLLRIIRGNSKDKNIPHRKNRDAVVISTKGIT